MATPGHFVDPDLGNANPDFRSMGLTAAEQRALGNDVDPSRVTDEFRIQEQTEASAMERYELERMTRENDQLRSQLGQTTQEIGSLRESTANVAGQLAAMQQAQQAQAQQAQLDAQFQFTPEELENHGELLPVIDKVIGKTTAQIQADYDAKLAAETARLREETQAELNQIRQQGETQQAQNAQRIAAELNREIADMGMGDINSLTSNPEFQKWQTTAVYSGATVGNGAELARHVQEGNTASAAAMLKAFKASSQSYQQQERDDNVVPAGRNTAPQTPMSSEQTKILQKRDALLARYKENMENANNNVFPRGIENRAQYKQLQANLQQEIDALPTV